MNPVFPSSEWLNSLCQKLNEDKKYAAIASKWEGDICVVIEPSGIIQDTIIYYLDLWHGKCRRAAILKSVDEEKAAFILSASYDNIARIMQGKLDPMQAMLTRKLIVRGSMAVMMRNVPTVLDFVRCAREITSEIL
ncbi:MAG: SCP2 sterol-binding domain-containing protein [Chloroflexota bacterium]